MARRTDYVSFFGTGRRASAGGLAGFEDRVGLEKFVLPILIVAILAVSVWWFAFRDVDADVGGVLTLEDANVPTLLLPSDAATDDAGLLLAGVSIDCHVEVVDWPLFQGSPERQGCVKAPTITNPKILWRVEMGVAGWLNNPVIANDTVFVGSAGVLQFISDRRDGVYAFDIDDGSQQWFFGTELDVNGIAYGDGIIVATGDEGRVWGIGARDGSLIWQKDHGAPTYSNPLVVGDLVVIGDGDGVVAAYDIRQGTLRWQRQVEGSVRGGAASDGEIIVIAGEDRDVLAVDLQGREVWRTELIERGPSGDLARIFAAPTMTDDLVIFTLLRNDVFAEPAVAALDKQTGALVWRAEDLAGIKHDWGNIRSSMALVGDILVYGEPYSNTVVALDAETGETLWDVATGAYCFPQWSSAAVVSGQVIVPRHDGGLYAVSIENEQVVWKIYVGNSNSSGTFPQDYPPPQDWDDPEYCEGTPEGSFSVLSSPAVSRTGIIVLGTLEGYLVAIGDRTW